MENEVAEVLRLGFGKCALQVQVPESSPYKSAEDLAGKRVVTSFEVLAGKHFKEVDSRLQLSGDAATKIEYVGGSVEAACALGLADGIGTSLAPFSIRTILRTSAVDLVGTHSILFLFSLSCS